MKRLLAIIIMVALGLVLAGVAAFALPLSDKYLISGDTLYIMSPAKDGTYELTDGTKVVVKDGRIIVKTKGQLPASATTGGQSPAPGRK